MSISEKLSNAAEIVIADAGGEVESVAALLLVVGEAIGYLQVVDDFNLKQMTDESIFLAAHAGHLPDRLKD